MSTIRLKKLAGLLNEESKSDGMPKLAWTIQDTQITVDKYLDRLLKTLEETLSGMTIGEIVDGFNSIGRKIKEGQLTREDKVKIIANLQILRSYAVNGNEIVVYLDTSGGRYRFLLPTDQHSIGKIGKGLADTGR